MQNLKPIKAVPITKAEWERVQNYFKFYSPIQSAVKVASGSRNAGEEEWKLERTLPSGLWLSVDLGEPSIWRENRFWQKPKKDPEGSEDLSQFQYDVQTHLRRHPWLKARLQSTYSLAWHPYRMLLVTNGSNGPVKLWDVQSGKLITKLPHRTSSPGLVASWSPDGAVFATEDRMFNGMTGELKRSLPGIGSRYSGNYHRMDAHIFSTAYNFGPWRPHSTQFVVDETVHFENRRDNGPNQWNPTPDLDGRTLVFQNRDSGVIERVIDCDVPSHIKDFAWHPSGKFVAVAFEEHNAHIIDIDEARTVAGLSVSRLVGWSPDGQTLVLRENAGKDFVTWKAIEGKEKPISEEIKSELWFKRFFKNISADGLRYVKTETNGTSIYSVDSDRLLATLPNSTNAAAWSPIDGRLLATCRGNLSTTLIDADSSGLERGGHTDIWRLAGSS